MAKEKDKDFRHSDDLVMEWFLVLLDAGLLFTALNVPENIKSEMLLLTGGLAALSIVIIRALARQERDPIKKE